MCNVREYSMLRVFEMFDKNTPTTLQSIITDFSDKELYMELGGSLRDYLDNIVEFQYIVKSETEEGFILSPTGVNTREEFRQMCKDYTCSSKTAL